MSHIFLTPDLFSLSKIIFFEQCFSCAKKTSTNSRIVEEDETKRKEGENDDSYLYEERIDRVISGNGSRTMNKLNRDEKADRSLKR